MTKILRLIKRNYLYIILFVFYFLCLQFFYTYFCMDTFSNYSFSYSLIKGEIAYNDFNLIVPLLSPFLYSLFLFFNHSLTTFFLEQAFLLTIFSSFLFHTFGKSKAWLFITFMILPWPISFVYVIFPGYNFLLIFFIAILIYLEKMKSSDKLIGLILGFLILTKHNVGILLLLPTLVYYRKDMKKIFLRYFYALIPVLILLIYLLLTKSLGTFINLTILGMFDFAKSNAHIILKIFFPLVILVIINLIKFLKTKDISYFYLLLAVTITLPIIDNYHFTLYAILFVYVFLFNSNINLKFNYINLKFIILINLIAVGTFYITVLSTNYLKFYNYHNFPMLILTENYKNSIDSLNEFLDNKDIIYLIYNNKTNIILLAMNEKKTTYYTLLNKGNHGYNGSKKMLQKLKNEKKKYIVIDNNLKSYKFDQGMSILANYVKNNCEKVKTIGVFDIYYKS